MELCGFIGCESQGLKFYIIPRPRCVINKIKKNSQQFAYRDKHSTVQCQF